jgi:hypothetical protein
VARQVARLLAAIRAEAPGLTVEQAASDRLRLLFDTPDTAGRFRDALVAENFDAAREDCAVELRVSPWYTADDVESMALAVAKVTHYLGIGQ